ncbi:MAG TPA: nuclear transport factor 2 family protein [Deltaproteobacteria bacterium]|nr:nuclear transport factor 2 family protein [Deltaproteobacteria bacterium]
MTQAPPPSDASGPSPRAIVERYFEGIRTGDPEVASLLADDVRWLAPRSSPVGRRHEGKPAVLELMSTGVGLYDTTRPLEMDFTAIVAEGERVFVELTLRATTRSGEPYANQYVFVFCVRDERIAEIHEYLDTLYAQKKLFDPVGEGVAGSR